MGLAKVQSMIQAMVTMYEPSLALLRHLTDNRKGVCSGWAAVVCWGTPAALVACCCVSLAAVLAFLVYRRRKGPTATERDCSQDRSVQHVPASGNWRDQFYREETSVPEDEPQGGVFSEEEKTPAVRRHAFERRSVRLTNAVPPAKPLPPAPLALDSVEDNAPLPPRPENLFEGSPVCVWCQSAAAVVECVTCRATEESPLYCGGCDVLLHSNASEHYEGVHERVSLL